MGEDGLEEREDEALLSFRAWRVYRPVRVEPIKDVMVGWLLIGVMTVVPIRVRSQDAAPAMTVVG